MIRYLAALLLPLAVSAAPAVIEPWPLPAGSAAAQPSLSRGAGGALNLSWIERSGNGHRLKFARYADARWSATRTIAEGDNWFVNWADFPSTTQLPDGTLWAHNLVKSAKGTYAYDVVLYRSSDGGNTWSAPIRVNDDGTPTEHGFATLWPWSKHELAIAWLDGRNTGGGNHDAHAGHGDATGNMMTLRAAVYDGKGRKTAEWPLDASTCDCCQTDAAVTDNGPVIIYRDRDPQEIRDVFTVRHADGRWQTPKAVAADQWHMPACPVNGPALAANGRSLWAAWYTGSGNVPKIRVAYSGNSGGAFLPARTVRTSPDVLGRVDLAADAGGAWLLWSEESGEQSLWLKRFAKTTDHGDKPLRLATLKGHGHGTGFARMQQTARGLYVVWTDVIDGRPVLRGALVK
ncbi:MAG: sialidase family protein [Arenimonas sp.]|uniref:sialidase family protein n=1 Tax=Arenimonas sp. TaxID=1872635 RepID=UPI003C0D9621